MSRRGVAYSWRWRWMVGGDGEAEAYLIDITEKGLFHTLVLDDLAEDAAVAAADDQDLLGVGVRVQGEVGDHLLVGELVPLGALDDLIQHQDGAVVGGLEQQDILVLALLVVQHLLDLERHSLAWRRRAWSGQEPLSAGPSGPQQGQTHRATYPRSLGTSHL